jgi:hypothetical protein
MKAKLLIIGLLYLSITSSIFGQSSDLNVCTPKTVILYRGIENPININFADASESELLIELSKGAILTKKNEQTSIFVPGNFSESTIKMSVQLASDKNKKEEYVFKVVDIPTPKVYLGELDRSVGSYSKEEVLNNLSFTITNQENFLYDVEYEIVSYDFFYYVGEVTNMVKIKSGDISNIVIDYVKTADAPSQKINFGLNLKGPDGVEMDAYFGVNIFNGWDK